MAVGRRSDYSVEDLARYDKAGGDLASFAEGVWAASLLHEYYAVVLSLRGLRNDIPREEAEEIARLGEELADYFKEKFGRRAEWVLVDIILNGYKEGFVDRIEGLDEVEKKDLKDLLNTPYERVALIFAYKKIGNLKYILVKLNMAAYWRSNIEYIRFYPVDPQGFKIS